MSKSAIITVITPQIAKDLLATNTNNRKVSRATVLRYSRDMAEGRWQNNGQSILVSETGELLDGQHRLLACIQSGVPFSAFLVKGIRADARATIDAGRKRSAADALMLAGHTPRYTTGVAASAKLILSYLRGESMIGSNISNSEVFDFVEAQPDVSEKHIIAAPAAKIVPSSAVGAILFLGTRQPGNERRATAFAEALTSGAGLRDDDPRLALRNLMINMRQRTPGGNLPKPSWTFPAVAIGWNAFALGQPQKVIRPLPNRLGRFSIPNIVGGPEFGSGVAAVMEGHISKERIRQIKANEERERAKLREKADAE